MEKKKQQSQDYPARVINKNFTLISAGTINYQNKEFHNSNYIYPVGFKSKRRYRSYKNKNTDTWYTNEIKQTTNDEFGNIEFVVTAEDDAQNPWTGNNPSIPWHRITEKIGTKTAVAGPEKFGFTEKIVREMIENLPNASLCEDYKNKHFCSIARKSHTESTTITTTTTTDSSPPFKKQKIEEVITDTVQPPQFTHTLTDNNNPPEELDTSYRKPWQLEYTPEEIDKFTGLEMKMDKTTSLLERDIRMHKILSQTRHQLEDVMDGLAMCTETTEKEIHILSSNAEQLVEEGVSYWSTDSAVLERFSEYDIILHNKLNRYKILLASVKNCYSLDCKEEEQMRKATESSEKEISDLRFKVIDL